MTVATLAPATSSAATKVVATSIPQANNIFRLLRILDLFEQSTATVSVDAVADMFSEVRDRSYYLNAATHTLRLIVRQGNALTLTEKGQELHALRADMPALCSALLVVLADNPYFKALEDEWTPEVIASIVAKDENLSTTTALRRVSTFQSWISFKGDGTLLVSKTLDAEKAALGIVDGMKLAGVHDATKTYLAYHRAHVFVDRKN